MKQRSEGNSNSSCLVNRNFTQFYFPSPQGWLHCSVVSMTSSKTMSPTTTRTKPRTLQSAALLSTHRGGSCAATSNIGREWPCAVTNSSILRKGLYPRTCLKYTQMSFKFAFKVHVGWLVYYGLWDILQIAVVVHCMWFENAQTIWTPFKVGSKFEF